TPFIGIVTLFFLDIIEMRSIVIKPIKYMSVIGGICGGIGAIFWAYTDFFLLHHFFLVGLGLLFACAILLVYGLIPGKEVKEKEYYREIPKIAGFNILHLSSIIVIGSMVVFAIFGALAAIIMLEIDEHFFLVEVVFLDRVTPKELFQELASFHMRLMNALLLTGVLILTFRYTGVKGKLAKIGLWLLLIGVIAMTAGYFLMVVMGKAANAILMPARAFILFTGIIIAFDAWRKVSKEELGSKYESSSLRSKITALLKNPLRLSMFVPFVLAGLVVVIPGMVIVANLEAYRDLSNYPVERNFATGHPHILITLGAIVIFCLILHNMIPKNKLRKLFGWTLLASLLFSSPAAAFYFLRSPTDFISESILKFIILGGLFLLFFDLLIFLGLVVYEAIFKRKKFSEDIIPLVIEF
ncbi:MAG: hypothetical protein ACFFKA_12650, partial [Candidatus Thorarchaeota archaeon]